MQQITWPPRYNLGERLPEDENFLLQPDALVNDLHQNHHLSAVFDDTRYVIFHQVKCLQQYQPAHLTPDCCLQVSKWSSANIHSWGVLASNTLPLSNSTRKSQESSLFRVFAPHVCGLIKESQKQQQLPQPPMFSWDGHLPSTNRDSASRSMFCSHQPSAFG